MNAASIRPAREAARRGPRSSRRVAGPTRPGIVRSAPRSAPPAGPPAASVRPGRRSHPSRRSAGAAASPPRSRRAAARSRREARRVHRPLWVHRAAMSATSDDRPCRRGSGGCLHDPELCRDHRARKLVAEVAPDCVDQVCAAILADDTGDEAAAVGTVLPGDDSGLADPGHEAMAASTSASSTRTPRTLTWPSRRPEQLEDAPFAPPGAVAGRVQPRSWLTVGVGPEAFGGLARGC